MHPSSILEGGYHLVSKRQFQIITWTLCGIGTLFLASRFAVRMHTKGRLMINDYFLIVALPTLYVGVGLLQSTMHVLYPPTTQRIGVLQPDDFVVRSTSKRFTAAIEMLWISIFSVKFCFLAQFKFHKPPYAYVSPHLTRYYWVVISLCTIGCLYALVQPIVLCSGAGECHYFTSSNTLRWEVSLTVVDIVTDVLVISIPMLLIHMANFTKSHTIINASFKSLSVFTIAIAATRLAVQYNSNQQRIDYDAVTFWLVVEAAVALSIASISSYRVVLLDYLAERRLRRSVGLGKRISRLRWPRASAREGSATTRSDGSPSNVQHSLSELPTIRNAQHDGAS